MASTALLNTEGLAKLRKQLVAVVSFDLRANQLSKQQWIVLYKLSITVDIFPTLQLLLENMDVLKVIILSAFPENEIARDAGRRRF